MLEMEQARHEDLKTKLKVINAEAADAYQREQVERQVETRLAFLKFASLHLISATKRQGLGPVWKSIAQAHGSAMRKMPTPMLTRLLQEAVAFQAPSRGGMYRPKMRYAHQGGMNPPVIVIHGNSLEHVTAAYKRFLEGRFRKEFDLVGTPMRIEFRTDETPFAGRRNELLKRLQDPSDELYFAGASEDALTAELEDRDYFKMVNVFWVPEVARWESIRAAAKQVDIGKRIDDALAAIEAEWCGLRNGRSRVRAPRSIRPATDQIIEVSSSSRDVRGGNRPGRRWAIIDLPDPGVPTIRK